MITRETLEEIPLHTSLLHPSILELPTGRWAVYPGGNWFMISGDVTVGDVESRWQRWQASEGTGPKVADGKTWQVTGSKGSAYQVSVSSNRWSCTCAGFGFRRKCTHIDKIKLEVSK
jgi:hypothetical protein